MGKESKPPKKAKQCIFCTNPRNSKEHFWPRWMHELLPSDDNQGHDRIVANFSPRDGKSEKGRRGAQGGVENLRIRAVCTNCNNGWMNRLESEARPYLTPIVTGSPVTLDHKQMGIVARWIAMKIIVSEHSTGQDSVTPAHDRYALREHGTIPPYFRIYMANHKLKEPAGFVRHSHTMAIGRRYLDPPLYGADKNAQACTFYLGKVFVHVTAFRVRDFDAERFIKIRHLHKHCRIWPPLHREMIWPRPPHFAIKSVHAIAESLSTFVRKKRKLWFPDKP